MLTVLLRVLTVCADCFAACADCLLTVCSYTQSVETAGVCAAEERKKSGLRMMANIVQNSISDLTQFGFVSWQ